MGYHVSPQILLVTGAVDFGERTRRLLVSAGMGVWVARGAVACQEYLWKGISLAIVDTGLPDGDGFALCRELRESTPGTDLPVLLLSRSAGMRDAVRGVAAGARDVLPASVEPASLLRFIRRLLQVMPTDPAEAEVLIAGGDRQDALVIRRSC